MSDKVVSIIRYLCFGQEDAALWAWWFCRDNIYLTKDAVNKFRKEYTLLDFWSYGLVRISIYILMVPIFTHSS